MFQVNHFHPVQSIEYSSYKTDSGQNNLKIYFSLDSSLFVYDKKNNNEYSGNIEVVFQISDKKTNREINRKILEIEILKDSFIETKKDNYYNSEINFNVEIIRFVASLMLIKYLSTFGLLNLIFFALNI